MDGILKGKVIAVSGGTKGIGREIVCEAARQGAKVVFCGRDEKAAKEIAEISKDIEYYKADISDVAQIESFFSYIENKYERLDGFVNYAGVTYAASLLECTEECFDSIFDTDIKAAFFCSKCAIKLMMKEGGAIVFFGSPHDEKGEYDRAAYACAKGSLKVLSTHISRFYAEYGIRSNYITTGWTMTEGEIFHGQSMGMTEEELREYASKLIPAGRMTEIDEYIPMIMLLLSDYSKMISGSDIRLTGGLYL